MPFGDLVVTKDPSDIFRISVTEAIQGWRDSDSSWPNVTSRANTSDKKLGRMNVQLPRWLTVRWVVGVTAN